MKTNKMTLAVRATTASLLMGVAGQAAAIELNAQDVEADLYGFARLNASYDIDEDISATTRAGSFDAVNTGAAEDNEVTGHFGADAVQSRLGVNVSLPEGVMVKVEGGFRPGQLRLRHAYGEYNNVLLGQTWSNFNSFVGFTSTLDFDALAGNAGLQGRTAQARYTSGPLSFSAEEAAEGGIQGGTATKQGLPAFTARFESSEGPLSFSAAGIVKQTAYDTGTMDDSVLGFGTFGAATFQLTDALSIQGVLTYTNGTNAYLYRSGDDFGASDAYLDANGGLETISGYGGTIGVSADAGAGTVNAGIGMVEVDWDDAQADGIAVANEHETNTNVMVNYQWSPVQNVTMGVELQHFMVEEVDGDDGDANRILFAGQYNF